MNKYKSFFVVFVLCFGMGLVVVSLACADEPALDGRPNVILIVTDDQGYGDMSCHGNPWLKTPEMDRLHDESVRLTDFHVDPTCAPTRAALMTGRYSSRVGVWLTYAGRHHLRRDEATCADLFQKSGYATAMFGKWHLGDNYPFRPQDRGFEESLIHGGGVVGEAPDHWGNDYYDDVYLRNGVREQVEGYCTDVWFREAARFVERNQEHPFFVYLATNAPHGPLHVPIKYVEPYLDDPEIPESRARFYGMLANIDENLGRLRRRLDDLDLSRETILVFMNDNGTATGVGLQPGKNGFPVSGYNAGMRGRKGTAYEGGHRSACFIHWPGGGLDQGRDVDLLSAHVDLLPTFVDLCGLDASSAKPFDGVSLAAVLRDAEKSLNDRTLFVHHQGRFGRPVMEGLPVKYQDYCVMTPQWRLVGHNDETFGLYDQRLDPGQRSNVAAEHPDAVVRLSAAYELWWNDISTQFEEYCPTIIDPSKQECVMLTCQDWHGDAIPYSQQHVRAAMPGNGYWMIDVVEPGRYAIELRRWPRELDKAIDAIVPDPDLDPTLYDPTNRLHLMPSAVVVPDSAVLRVGDLVSTKPVAESDKSVQFFVDLPQGEQSLQTWWTGVGAGVYGAYYVYIELDE